MRKPKAVTFFADELEGQDWPPTCAVLKDLRITADPIRMYIALCYLGGVDPEEEIPVAVEEPFPEQFRRKTLVETPPVSDKVQ